MVISTSLLIKLGSSITKAILKFWLKDHDFSQNISVDIAEMLGEKTEDLLAKRKTIRFFDRMSEELADEIAENFKNSSKDITIEDKNLITSALEDTLEKLKLNDEIIFNKDLDPLRLYHYIKELKISSNKHLSKNQIKEYDKILIEICNYIVEIVFTLPDFTQKNAKELLSRETESIQLIKKILDNLPKGKITKGYEEDDDFETAYCRRVAQKLDSIEIF